MLSSGCKARFTASESSPEQRSISRSISFGVTIIFASSAGSFVLLPDTSRASVCASTTVGTPTDMTGTPSVFRLISARELPTPEPGIIPLSDKHDVG